MTLTALVTGANRGIGRETALQLARQKIRVIIAGRDPAGCEQVAGEIRASGGQASVQALDMNDRQSIAACIERCPDADILVNNAGSFPDPGISVFEVDPETVRTAMQLHLHGPLHLCQALVAQMQTRGYGRVVNLTSGYANLHDMSGQLTAYRTSKAALNALTCVLAAEITGNLKINAVDPGWVRTDMGGEQAPRSVEDAAADVVWAATLHADGPSGKLLRYRSVVEW